MEATTTDELRAELTRRGIEWREWAKLRTPDYCTVFKARGIKWLVLENPNSHGMNVTNYRDELTLDESLEATLGSSSCSNSDRTASRVRVIVDEHGAVGHDECSLCWSSIGSEDRFCKHCGARLEDA